ncbi:MAG: hypothetical protein LBF77_06585 [Spirochaetaceae bacterium]|jgi:hypothetical protein|nr:hypothetical protein [Spirochaetaceae bacterium]
MAQFKTLRKKAPRYVFDFLKNREDPEPAAVVFARFPQPGEDFTPRIPGTIFDGINAEALAKRDPEALDKFSNNFLDHFTKHMKKVDYGCFIRECADHFENFWSDGKEIKTIDDFTALPQEMWRVIAADCYQYASQKDEFTMGESGA